jgi:hypothetical protein
MIKANEKTKAGLHTVSLLESLHVMLATPKLLTDAAIGLVCASLRELYELVRLNPLNNILHGLVVRVTKQVGYVYQGQPSRMLAFLDTMVAVLLTFNESLFRDEPCGRAGSAGSDGELQVREELRMGCLRAGIMPVARRHQRVACRCIHNAATLPTDRL